MIVFQNPGLIDLDAVRTMGVNVKVHPGAFGHFGTGLKFAIATVLRGGGGVVLYRGTESFDFTLVEKTIRGEQFRIVCMNGQEMGFTDQLGRNWEPWMVLREFGCNALDEQGTFWQAEVDCYSQEDMTTFEVSWDALDEVWAERDQVFIGDRPVLLETPQVQVLEGESQYLFYRGIRAYRLQKPSVVTYNILSQQILSEDRNIAHFYYPMGEIRRLWLECESKEALERVLVAGEGRFEHSIDYMETNRHPTREFLDVVLDARMVKELKKSINESAVKLLHKSIRSSKEEGVGYSTSRYMQDEFGAAMEALDDVFPGNSLRLDSIRMVLVEEDEVREGSLAMLEDGRLYVARPLLRRGRREIAQTVLPLVLELLCEDMESLIELVVPALLQSNSDLRESRHNLPLDLDRDPETETEEDPEGVLLG